MGIGLRRSRLASRLGLVAFVSAVTIVPLLHNLGHHAGDHDHGHGAWTETAAESPGDEHRHGDPGLDRGDWPEQVADHHEAGHRHGDGDHRHGPGTAAGTPGASPEDRHHHVEPGHGQERAPHSPDHGDGALEHLGAAYASAAVFVLTLGSDPAHATPVPMLASVPEPGHWPTPMQPRAPPASSSRTV
jgi:hypothetical protein